MLKARGFPKGIFVDARVMACLAVAISLLLSLLAAATDDVLNPDGMLYVDVARVFVEQGFGAALGKFNWPFLSMLIGALHVATGLSFIVASHLLDVIVLAALSAGFVLLYREMGGPRAWVAAAVIVLSPFLNEYRDYVIRDFGYWCFGLWSILFFVRFCREQDWGNALAWQLCVLAAVAFRIEAVALAALLPLYCGLLPRERLLAWLRAAASPAFACHVCRNTGPCFSRSCRMTSPVWSVEPSSTTISSLSAVSWGMTEARQRGSRSA